MSEQLEVVEIPDGVTPETVEAAISACEKVGIDAVELDGEGKIRPTLACFAAMFAINSEKQRALLEET